MDAERLVAAALLALLRGREPSLAPLPARDVLEGRARDGDPDAPALVRVRAHLDTLPSRVERALAEERADVVLADGSALPLDDAEKLLAHKEERQAHATLRASVDAALAPFRQVHSYGSDIGADGLRRLLAETRALKDAARDALATLGGELPDHPAALARALDLPDDTGAFGADVTAALLGAARAAAGPGTVVARFRAPRAMAGLVLVDDDVRFAWPNTMRRYDRHARTLEGGAVALARALARERGDDDAERAAFLGVAMAHGLLAAPARRALGASRSAAERAARVAKATAVLAIRATAALALLDDAGGARDVLVDALGANPGPALTARLLARPWTLDDNRARIWLRAPALALALRDAYDENYALVKDAWRESPIVDDVDPAAALIAWAGEAL